MSMSLKPLGLAVALALLAGCNQAAPPVDPAATTADDAMQAGPVATDAAAPATMPADVPAPQLQAAMRDLWHGHIAAAAVASASLPALTASA